MIAAVEFQDRVCVIRWVGRVRMHVEALTGCGQRVDVTSGVVQIPQGVLDGRAVASVSEPRRALKLCGQCKNALAGV
jgi:hypothetical protein